MPEILTESFCERCGTRYTFESAAPRAPRLKGLRVVSRGLKNFVMSDDSSLDEAMAAARSDTEREQTAHQLDAFHKTFNFCMTCRQYTCGNCWNEAEGRCLTCAPHLGQEIMPAPFPDLDPHGGFGAASNGNGHSPSDPAPASGLGAAPMSWPTSDRMQEPATQGFDDGAAPGDLDVDDLEPIDAMARLASIGAYDDEVATAPAPADATALEAEPVPTEPDAEAKLVATEADSEADALDRLEADAEAEALVAGADAEADALAAAAEADAWGGDAPETQALTGATQPDAADPVTATDDAPTDVLGEAVETTQPAADHLDARVAATWPAASDAAGVPADAGPGDEPVGRIDATDEGDAPIPGPASISEADVAGRASAAAAQTNRLLRRFRPGQSLDDEIAAFEAGQPHERAATATPELEAPPEPEPAAAAAELEPEVVAAAPEPEPSAAEPELEPEPVAAAAELEPELEPEIVAAAPELVAAWPEPVAAAPEPEPEPVAAAPEPVAAWPEPIAAAPEPEPEPVAAAPEPEPIAATPELEPNAAAPEPEPVAAEPEPEPTTPPVAAAPDLDPAAPTAGPTRDDVVAQPTWRIVAPDPSAAPHDPATPATGPVAPAPEPQWPTRPEWPARPAAGGLPFLDRPPVVSGGIEALWAESAREVVTAAPAGPAAQPTGGVQPCVSCGLSLSATARFCRRCGTRQG